MRDLELISALASATSYADVLALAGRLGVERLDAQLLLLHAQGTPAQSASGRRAWLLAHADDHAPREQVQQFSALVGRRLSGEPLAYIVGHREFHGIDLRVDSRVLVPRADTETLVAWALDVLDQDPNARSVLDLGTGSGAVALAIKHARPHIDVCAVDRSASALALASANADALGLVVEFIESDWLQGLARPFDLIVSNPPYIAAGDPHLNALRHEPLEALVSGADGLDAIRVIARQAVDFLRSDGWLLLEHGFDQAADVRAILQHAGYREASTRLDLAGHSRCTGGRRDPSHAQPSAKVK